LTNVRGSRELKNECIVWTGRYTGHRDAKGIISGTRVGNIKQTARVDIYAQIAIIHVVAYLLKASTVEPVKQPLLGNDCVTRYNGITIERDVFCAVLAEAVKRGPAANTKVPLRWQNSGKLV
jgi:hypothetical protein